VLVSNLSATAASFISGQLSDPPGNLFQNQPAQASVASNMPVSITVQPALAGPPYVSDDPEPTDYKHFEIYSFGNGTTTNAGSRKT